jgi:hypothetical protein
MKTEVSHTLAQTSIQINNLESVCPRSRNCVSGTCTRHQTLRTDRIISLQSQNPPLQLLDPNLFTPPRHPHTPFSLAPPTQPTNLPPLKTEVSHTLAQTSNQINNLETVCPRSRNCVSGTCTRHIQPEGTCTRKVTAGRLPDPRGTRELRHSAAERCTCHPQQSISHHNLLLFCTPHNRSRPEKLHPSSCLPHHPSPHSHPDNSHPSCLTHLSSPHLDDSVLIFNNFPRPFFYRALCQNRTHPTKMDTRLSENTLQLSISLPTLDHLFYTPNSLSRPENFHPSSCPRHLSSPHQKDSVLFFKDFPKPLSYQALCQKRSHLTKLDTRPPENNLQLSTSLPTVDHLFCKPHSRSLHPGLTRRFSPHQEDSVVIWNNFPNLFLKDFPTTNFYPELCRNEIRVTEPHTHRRVETNRQLVISLDTDATQDPIFCTHHNPHLETFHSCPSPAPQPLPHETRNPKPAITTNTSICVTFIIAGLALVPLLLLRSAHHRTSRTTGMLIRQAYNLLKIVRRSGTQERQIVLICILIVISNASAVATRREPEIPRNQHRANIRRSERSQRRRRVTTVLFRDLPPKARRKLCKRMSKRAMLNSIIEAFKTRTTVKFVLGVRTTAPGPARQWTTPTKEQLELPPLVIQLALLALVSSEPLMYTVAILALVLANVLPSAALGKTKRNGSQPKKSEQNRPPATVRPRKHLLPYYLAAVLLTQHHTAPIQLLALIHETRGTHPQSPLPQKKWLQEERFHEQPHSTTRPKHNHVSPQQKCGPEAGQNPYLPHVSNPDLWQPPLKEDQMQIFLKTPSGKTITILTNPNDTIGRIKEIVRNKEGIPLKEQRLVEQANN